MDVAPLVSAYRYRFHVLDVYGARLGGLARPAPTIEEALRSAAAELRKTADPPAALRRLAAGINAETRLALRDVIARAENDLAIAITRFGTEIGAPPTGPHIDLRASLDGLDRSYRTADPAPEDFDAWYDLLDAQIAHLASLAHLEKELEAARAAHAGIKVPDGGRARLKWFLGAMVLAAGAALAIAVVTSMHLLNGPADLAQPGPEAPRVVRTVPITVTPPSLEASLDPACRTFALEVSAEGASLMDAPQNGNAVVRLEPGERVVLRRVLDLGLTRMIEVDAPGRAAHGFIAEREARLPVMSWTCDR